ncbi:MAG TPA: serine/threonine-protein kinase, partial [Candidatus Xenobia bacterium]
MLSPGQILQQRYAIEKVLGEGGMGAVYLARQTRIGGKRVAIKEVRLDLHDEKARTRAIAQFHAEAEILSSLDHLGLVKVLGSFVEETAEYLVMEYIDGQTLDGLLHRQRQFLPVAQVVSWMDQLCAVLLYLHTHEPQVIFRDLKPSNIMLDSAGRIRLIDFGIAKTADQDLSKTSTLIKGAGTHGFAPPEQYGSGTTDPRSDIYSLGATMFVLLTRILPPPSIAIASGEKSVPPPSQMNPSVPPGLDQVVLKCMASRKADRFQSIEEVRRALEVAWAMSSVAFMTSRFCPHCGVAMQP